MKLTDDKLVDIDDVESLRAVIEAITGKPLYEPLPNAIGPTWSMRRVDDKMVDEVFYDTVSPSAESLVLDTAPYTSAWLLEWEWTSGFGHHHRCSVLLVDEKASWGDGAMRTRTLYRRNGAFSDEMVRACILLHMSGVTRGEVGEWYW
ncbi:hypothetical protein [Bifidobacterium platyrrhinorum]|uniref:Uncharacterized protein n=1 Tax=Bifidobacterium platyrrhinorum TaxID=2661628 RepID=A0A6L9SV66_9BIFI|nr:hypothetical protein [Bifidobacterium platyrrhinorum]NEG55442.1 hypothetical protein [Bifidobacterium platyrrhinorum]